MAAKRSHYSTGPQPQVRLLVAARSGGCCERCACALPIGGGDVHHRKPRRMGGTSDPQINAPTNLVALCRSCHDWIESHRTRALADGWLIPSTGDPAATPVRSWLHGRVLLTNDGDTIPTAEGAAS
ncbi:HNH endonuclease [Nocardia cyriacigeorgica]|uniref:HNH endonuclease n=1 Tax=Nocardia cyriacigeorgica TaxID=135487 RepID=A0ABX0CE78_9NOCA|nr:HNH endonuclease signature motif containing protein [Nocardia cyriacigeorgica]NEW42757.1 HNH endonuclease [Nocardia cyriacigeorgica]NEW53948.1 HNH endonuclease [Nocardia cyriacigeorgica]NEW54463.1 HNH endonuclease [Nocardia cyriacigeorgica]